MIVMNMIIKGEYENMEITLIKINDNTLKTTYEKVACFDDEYKDKEILYDTDCVGIVCVYSDVSYYERLLLRELISETSKELNNAHDEVCRLNERYIGLVNKLIGE